jgi:hypothetical protein
MTVSCIFRDQNDCFLVPRANSATLTAGAKLANRMQFIQELSSKFSSMRTRMTTNCILRDQNGCFPVRISIVGHVGG